MFDIWKSWKCFLKMTILSHRKPPKNHLIDTLGIRSAGALTTGPLGSGRDLIVFIPLFQVSYAYSLHKPTYATTLPKQPPKAPFCICRQLYLLHPVWSFKSVTALVKHPHTSTWHVPSTANLVRPNLLTWSRKRRIACRMSRYVSSRTDVILLNRTQSPPAPFLNTLGLPCV